MQAERFLGLMSGTSVDGVDAALVRFDDDIPTLETTFGRPHSGRLRDAIATLCNPGYDAIDAVGPVDREVAMAFAEAALALLSKAGLGSEAVTAIGSHGQTVRHRPEANPPFTLQLGDPSTIAELTGITVVADFRRRDIAAGGEGAPLAPAFHRACFGRARCRRAIVNIGGIANATLLDGEELVGGFDSGPGNTLLDAWTRRHRGADYDAHGAWSAEGTVLPALLERCLADSFFKREGPRSTGREYFDSAWLARQLAALPASDPRDVQATLAELTARSIQRSLAAFAPEEVYICGGGAHNADLMRRLYGALAPARLDTTAALGIDPDWVEAAAFAWLARQTLRGAPGNAPMVTGAAGPRVLGGIYPAGAMPQPPGSGH